MSINASALNSLQTRINNERSRRSLSPITFTDGSHVTGDTIKAVHFNELRSGTEGLNTLGSQTFNWSGSIAVGSSITDVTTQIGNFITTLENETLGSWKTLTPTHNYDYDGSSGWRRQTWTIPSAAYTAGNVRWKCNIPSEVGVSVTWSHVFFLRSNNASSFAGVGWQNGMNTLANLANGNLQNALGIPPSNLQLFSTEGASVDQTPYTYREHKGVGTVNPHNAQRGSIAAVWVYLANLYVASPNHYYYTVKDHDTTWDELTLFSFTVPGNTGLAHPIDLTTVEAYY